MVSAPNAAENGPEESAWKMEFPAFDQYRLSPYLNATVIFRMLFIGYHINLLIEEENQ